MMSSVGQLSPNVRVGVGPGADGVGIGPMPSGGQTGGDGGFGLMLDQLVGGIGQSLRAGEMAAVNGIVGTGSVQDTVEGIMAAEQSLQVGIGIRDRIVNAYLELSRMSI